MLEIKKPGIYLSTKEVASLRGVSHETVKSWTKRGLPHLKGPGTMGFLFLKEDAENFEPNRVGKPLGNVAKR